MKSIAQLLLAVAVLASGTAHAQGLLSLGQSRDYKENVPLTFRVTAGGGYDSFSYKNAAPGLGDVSSWFYRGGVGLTFADVQKTTKWDINADFGAVRYTGKTETGDDLFYDARAAINFSTEVTRRLTVSDSFYLTYEAEPDFGAGVSIGRRAGQYLYGYNNFNVAYAWSERLSSTTGYTINGIKYMDDNTIASLEDRITHTFAEALSYKLSRTTALSVEYRYATTNYNNDTPGVPSPDYHSHFLLAGIDQAWSTTTRAGLRVGAEFYESERTSKTAPYVEGSISHNISRNTNVRLYGQVGFDGSELGSYDSRYSYRTGITASNQVTRDLTATGGVHYVHSTFSGNDTVTGYSENEVNLSLGLNYSITRNVGVEAGYSYTTIGSDIDIRDYDRHHVNFGLNATF